MQPLGDGNVEQRVDTRLLFRFCVIHPLQTIVIIAKVKVTIAPIAIILVAIILIAAAALPIVVITGGSSIIDARRRRRCCCDLVPHYARQRVLLRHPLHHAPPRLRCIPRAHDASTIVTDTCSGY